MDFTLQEFHELPFHKRFLILIIILSAFFGLFYYFIYKPEKDEVTKLQSQLKKLNQQIIQKKKVVKNIKQFKREFAQIKNDLDASLQQLPDKEMIDTILMNIARFERQENLESILFKPKKEIRRDFFAVVPIQIQIRGTYRQIGKFFEDVANLPRIVNVKEYKFTNPIDKGGVVLITADCAIETYRYIPNKEKASKGESGKKNGKKKK